MFLSSTSPESRYYLDVVFDESGQHIEASRCLVQTHDVRGVTEDSQMMEELRSICDQSPIKCEVFEPHFVFFDQVGGRVTAGFCGVSLVPRQDMGILRTSEAGGRVSLFVV